MKISDLEFCLVQMERGTQRSPVRSLLVRLGTDAGIEGWGEARVEWRAAELPARRDALLPVLSGRNVFDIEELLQLEVLGERPIRCALEMASWDLVGRAAGEPLCNLFGGAYRPRIPLAVRLSGDSADRVAQLARELAEKGFHSQIVSSCGRPQTDRQTVVAVRESVGDRAELRLDAAARYDMDTARDLCADLEADGLQFLIDPLDTAELYPIAALSRQTTVPLAVWRAIGGPADVLALVRCGAAPFVVVDLEQVGGMVAARKCAAVAEAAGLSASLAGGPSLGPAAAAMLHLAASTPALTSCHECTCHQLQDDLLTEPLEIADGMIAVPQAPGLGIEIDRAKLERYQVT
jgi:L-alanine-DL-glutamate epimerase-like enolase superfamily enzyme